MKCIVLVFIIFSFSSFSQDRDWNLYKQAVSKSYDFKNLKKPKVLFNINDSNQNLAVSCNPRWNCSGAVGNWEKNGEFKENIRVRMVSWVSKGTANKYFVPLVNGSKPYNTGSRHLWVSAFPQVQNFCRKIKTANVRLRLEQFMGLPPTGNKTHFVHVWVKPRDLFRPCYDENVSDTECDYTLPKNISSEHSKWMNNQLIDAYPKQGTRFPWTRLGYTYDWGNPKGYVGASEYVIKANSDIYVESVTSMGIYCAK